MSPSMLNIKPEEINTTEKCEKHTVSIIGCREIGFLHAYLFAEAGFKVVCVDADQTIVNSISKGKIPFLEREKELKLRNYIKRGHVSSTNDARTAVSKSDIIVITTSAKIDAKKKTSYSEIESICKHVGSGLRQGTLIIVTSILGVGVTEGLIREILENASGLKVGVDFGLVYSPIQLFNGRTLEKPENYGRAVAATDKNSLDTASAILEKITKDNIRKTETVKAAEVTALFETVRQDANIALVNELAFLCEKAGVDFIEVHKLLNNSGDSAVFFPTLVNERLGEKPYLLMDDAENLNVKLRIPAIAREINEETIRHALNLTKDALKACGKTLRRARISLLGISQVPNMKGSLKKTVKRLAEMLEARGAKISLYDPYFASEEQIKMHHPFSKNLTEAVEGADCILILTAHEQFKRLNLKKLKVTMKMPAAIIDFEGIVEPSSIEKEGFIYRGFGRGVWTK